MVGEEVDADDALGGAVGHQLDHAVGLAGDHRLGVDGHGHLHLHRVDALGLGLLHGEADEGRLRAGEDDAAVLVLVVAGVLAEEVGGRHPPLLAGGMGEHEAAVDVADGEDVGDVGAAAGVHRDDAVLGLHAGLVQGQGLEHRALAGGHEDVVASELGPVALGILVHQGHGPGPTADLGHLDGGVDG